MLGPIRQVGQPIGLLLVRPENGGQITTYTTSLHYVLKVLYISYT
jgi:hypothetical protein